MLAGSGDHHEEGRGPSWTVLPLAYRYQPETLVQPDQLEADTLTGDRDRMPTGSSAPEASYAADFVQPYVDDRVLISIPDSQQVENLGRRSYSTYQL